MLLKNRNISILGCGWLGLALGEELAEQGYFVKGSTTTQAKMKKLVERGIIPFLIQFDPKPKGHDLHRFLQSQVLIISIPPQTGIKGNMHHPNQIWEITKYFQSSEIEKVIYISSTSVYPEVEREVTEEEALSAENTPGIALLQAEEILKNKENIQLTILRCGGLMGYDRIPGKYFNGRKGLKTAKIPVNFIHRDDVIGIIIQIIQQEKWGEIFNVVAPKHPVRRDVYRANAREFGFQEPEYVLAEPKGFKIVNSDKVIRALNYEFKYPDPLYFRYS